MQVSSQMLVAAMSGWTALARFQLTAVRTNNRPATGHCDGRTPAGRLPRLALKTPESARRSTMFRRTLEAIEQNVVAAASHARAEGERV